MWASSVRSATAGAESVEHGCFQSLGAPQVLLYDDGRTEPEPTHLFLGSDLLSELSALLTGARRPECVVAREQAGNERLFVP